MVELYIIPFDTQNPVKAIQTDIVSTGGSSGSSIIDPLDAKVIGIATNVIGAKLWAKYYLKIKNIIIWWIGKNSTCIWSLISLLL